MFVYKAYLILQITHQVGSWHDRFGIKFSRNFTESYSEIVESLQNKTLVVTTIMVSERKNTFEK